MHEVQDVAKYLAVRQLPTFMFFVNGAKVGEYTGTAVAEVIKQMKQYKEEAAKNADVSGDSKQSQGGGVGMFIKGLLIAGVGSFAYLASQVRSNRIALLLTRQDLSILIP